MSSLIDQLPEEFREAVRGEFERLEKRNRLLLEEIRLLRMAKYGASSEKFSDAQIALLELEPGVQAGEVQTELERGKELQAEIEAAASEEKQPRKRPVRTGFPAHYPRQEIVIPCAPEQCQCALCGKPTTVFGYEISEELGCKPAEYFVRVNKREKRACKGCEEAGVQTAPAPAKIVPKGKFSNEVVVDIVVKKYADHIPLYRQSAILERDVQIDASRATLCACVMKVGGDLTAITRAMREDLLKGNYIQADETPVGVQTEKVKGRNHQAYIWEYSDPKKMVLFEFQMGRGRDGPRNFLGNFAGVLQSDGYGAYDKIGGEGMLHAGCWAHVRRGFDQAAAVAENDIRALKIVHQINGLYDIERTARDKGLDFEARRKLRQEKSTPLMTPLKDLILKTRQEVLPKSKLGKACDYALSQWARLQVYLNHGAVEIDQNRCENAIRPIALGRKNWLHIGSEEAGPRVAAIMSVIESCRRLGVNIRDYLLDVLPGLAETKSSEVHALTPYAWANAQKR